MPQKPKPPSGVSRNEFEELKREVAEMKPVVADNRHRIEALELSDKEIKEEQVRTVRQLAEMSSKFDRFVESQSRANDEIVESGKKTEAMLGLIVGGLRLDEGDGAKGRLREGINHLYDQLEASKQRKKTLNEKLTEHVLLIVLLLAIGGGLWYIAGGQVPLGAAIQPK